MVSVFQLGTTDLQMFLITVIASGLAGVAVSWVIEQFAPGWHTAPAWLPPWVRAHWPLVKRWAVFLGAVAVPFLITLFLLGSGPEFIAQASVWQSLTAQGLVVWLGTQFGHAVDPAVVRLGLKALIDLLITSATNATLTKRAAGESEIEKALRRAG